MKVKEQVTQTVTATKRIALNAEQFVQATALTILAGFSWFALHKLHVSEITDWIVTVALVVCGLRAAVEYVRFLDR